MKEALLVGIGSFIGGASRYMIGMLSIYIFPSQRLPLGTITVNIIGCFLIGLLSGLSENKGYLTPQIQLLLITGVLGGFTTFSAFSYETVSLFRNSSPLIAATNILLSVALGILSVWLGLLLTRSA